MNLSNEIFQFEKAYTYVLWKIILESFNKISIKFKKLEWNLLSGYDLTRSLQQFIIHEVNRFDEYE